MSRNLSVIMCFALAIPFCIGTSLAQSAGSASASTTADPVAFVYVGSNYKANTSRVYGFAAAADGTLTPTPYSPYSHNVYVDATNGKYLFGTGYGNDPSVYPNIYSFSIGPHGYLTQAAVTDVQEFPDSTCASPGFVVLDHTGSSLYSPTYDSDCSDDTAFMSFDISNSTGKLTFLSETVSGDNYYFPFNFIGNNQLAYSVGGYYDNFNGFRRAQNGAVSVISISAPYVYDADGNAYAPQAAAADPTNHLAIVQLEAPPGVFQLSSYTVDESNGNLFTTSTYENMPTISVAGPRNNISGVTALSMSPVGNLVAVGGTTGLQIFHFNGANPPTAYTGALTTDEIDQAYWDNDNHLYAISKSAGELFVFTVTPTSVNQAPGSPYSITAPDSLTVDPLGSSCSAPSAPGVNLCSPASGSSVSSPVRVAAAANVSGTISTTQLWVDGVKKYSIAGTSLNTSVSLSAGTHRFAVVATNKAGQKWEQAINATVQAAGCATPPSTPDSVNICLPAGGSTVASPVHVEAAASDNTFFARMELWVDGKKKYSTTSNPLDTSVSLAAGKHRFAVLAIYGDSNMPERVVYATVK